jgi:hypothetical protein
MRKIWVGVPVGNPVGVRFIREYTAYWIDGRNTAIVWGKGTLCKFDVCRACVGLSYRRRDVSVLEDASTVRAAELLEIAPPSETTPAVPSDSSNSSTSSRLVHHQLLARLTIVRHLLNVLPLLQIQPAKST